MTCVVVASVLAAPAALADPKHGQPYGTYRNASQGNANQDFDYARVIHVEPIIRQVRVDVPQRECWMETRYDQPTPSYGGTAGPTLVGALIGGAIGHQVGAGRGKDAATVAGIVIGSALGHNAAVRSQAQYASAQPQPYQVERCDQRIQQTYEERIDGYQVEYEYCGRHYFTRLPYDPGERLRVQVDVRPS